MAGVRLWDTRTAWLNNEPARGQWALAHLDANVHKAEANGVRHISLVLAGTPRWAAAQVRPQDAQWMGPGSASPPRRMADWTSCVSTVAARYAGRIDAYELWNEPNKRTFWSGTPRQWATLVDAGARAIAAADPGAQLVTGAFSLGSSGQVPSLRPWLAALAATSAGSTPGVIDAISIHWYPTAQADPDDLVTAVAALRRLMREAGLAATEVRVTEANVRDGARLSAAQQRRWVVELTSAAKRAGVAPITWYAWSDLPIARLMPLQPGAPAAAALRSLD